MSNYIESEKIKVFPTNKRNDIYDRNARLTSEQNLINIINVLTDLNSFIINEFTLSSYSSSRIINIGSGSCNIHGYYFNIIDTTSNIDFGNNSSTDDVICLKIKEEINSLENIETSFKELVGSDNNNFYEGLEVVRINNITATNLKNNKWHEKYINYDIYYLPIFKWDGTKWNKFPNNNLKFTEDIINIKQSVTNLFTDNQSPETANLTDFISKLNYLKIDDGVVS